MTTEKFIKKTLIKVVILIIVMTAVLTFSNAASTIINNYISLGQMENNDNMFVLMEMYHNFLKPTVIVIVTAVSGVISFGIGTDIYKFIKNKKEGN